ncbi:MAG TPA: 6-phosphogluconolactonase, partial [Blastocatellia bacterium]
MKIIRKPGCEVLIHSDAAELAREAARRFAGMAQTCVKSAGRCAVALSGGSTPKTMFQILAEKSYAETIPWPSIYFFWGDERCVPPDHADSNYRMAYETLLSKVPVPRENIFRIRAEDKDPERAAADYSETLRKFFGGERIVFDIVFLGMGADGHTASLFPGTAALRANDRIAAANYVEKFQSWRITLTAGAINNARNIIFLVAGADKAP